MLYGVETIGRAEPKRGALQTIWNSIHVNQVLELELWSGVGGAPGGLPASHAPGGQTAAAAAEGDELAIDLEPKFGRPAAA